MKGKRNQRGPRKRKEITFEVVKGEEMSQEVAQQAASILAGWLMDDMKKESRGPKAGDTQQQLDEARKKLKSVQSIIEMMRGNTDPETLKKLQKEWVDPIVDTIDRLEAGEKMI